MGDLLKKAFGLIKDIILVILFVAFILLVWIPFAGFFSGTVGLLVGLLLSRGLRACFSSPFLLAITLSFATFFHLFPISYALVRLKNIFFRNLELLSGKIPEKRFSSVAIVRETVQVVLGRLPSFLMFFLAAVLIVNFFLPFESGTRRKFWENIDFISAPVAALFAIAVVYYSLCESRNAPFPGFGKWLNRKFVESKLRLKNFFSYRAIETEEEVARQKHFDQAPVLALVGLFVGLLGGIVVSISLAFIILSPVWIFLTAAFFSLFHLSDFRRMFREKQWLGIIGRAVILLAFSSYLAGFICFSIIGAPYLMVLSMLPLVPFGMLCGLGWIWTDKYFPENPILRWFDEVGRGAYKLGAFWKND